MSMHKKPLTELERKGLELHGFAIGTPSQLSDCFRHGIAYALQSLSELATEAGDAFGDGFFDGFIAGAKHQDKEQGNTDYLADIAMMESEDAESKKLEHIGVPTLRKNHSFKQIAQAYKTGFLDGLHLEKPKQNPLSTATAIDLIKVQTERLAESRAYEYAKNQGKGDKNGSSD